MLSAIFGRQSSKEPSPDMPSSSVGSGDAAPAAPSSGAERRRSGSTRKGTPSTSDDPVASSPPVPAPRRNHRPAPPRPISIASALSAGGAMLTGSLPSSEAAGSGTVVGSAPTSSAHTRIAREMHTMSGWIHKIETRPLLGVITRRRYWFALAEASPYLYWFKDRADVQCLGRVSLAGAAFTFDAREKGKFTIHANNEEHVFETGDNTMREEWMRALQETRKRSWNAHNITIEKEIHSLTTHVGTPNSPYASCVFEEAPSTSAGGGQQKEEVKATAITSPSVDDLLQELGPKSTSSSSDEDNTMIEDGRTEQQEGVTMIGDGRPARTTSPSIPIPSSPNSTFYLTTDGSLNEHSLEMPKEVQSPEAVLTRIAERTQDGIERPARRAIDMARLQLREFREGKGKGCDQCKKLAESLAETEERASESEELIEVLEERSKNLQKALLTTTRQLETAKKMQNMTREDEEEVLFVLEKEKELTHAQMRVNELQRKLQDAEEENRRQESSVNSLHTDIEAFRDSLRTKEELIMRLTEQREEEEQKESRRNSVFGDVDVPEAILIDDNSCILVEEESRRLCDEQAVRDVQEMRDLVEGYRTQNAALNAEIIELHKMLQSYDEKERKLTRHNFEIQGCYYQLKSRYIMVLNHFKSPEKPGKIMEPGVLRELIDEANRTPRSARREKDGKATDTLGFYLEGQSSGGDQNGGGKGDMFETAADCQKKANEVMEASKLEQSEEYMKWLQNWDGFLVNSVNNRASLASSPELKALVRTGVPIAYRARVWLRLVTMHVRERQAEMGNGYFECMLKKAKKKKEEGVFDASIKQIDLDLARTLPTNKYFEDPNSERMEALRRVLYAFRYHNTEVGYCQGLNRLAAIGLLYLSEEDAFWFLTACVEVLQPPGYYTTTLIGAVADQRVLRDLVQEKLPRLANHLRTLEVDLSLFTLSWFLTCFVDVLPHSVYLNIFDVFLYEGHKVLFRFALAVLKLGESLVLQCKTIGTVHACLSRSSEFVPDFKKLAQVAFNELNPFPQTAIEQKRKKYLEQLRDQGYR